MGLENRQRKRTVLSWWVVDKCLVFEFIILLCLLMWPRWCSARQSSSERPRSSSQFKHGRRAVGWTQAVERRHTGTRLTFYDRIQVCVEPPSSTLNMTLPASHLLLSAGACSTARPQLSIDIAGRSAAYSPASLLLSVDGTDRRTDAWSLHKPCSAYYAGSVGNLKRHFFMHLY